MPVCPVIFADHPAHLGGVELGASETTPWCERDRPGRARNSGHRVVATTSKGDCAPRSPSRAMRSSEVGSAPVQVLEGAGRTTGCVRAPARTFRPSSPPACRAPLHFLGRQLRPGAPPQRECRPAARAGAYLGRVNADQPKSRSRGRRDVLEIGRVEASPKRSLPHSASGCRGVFCRSCEAAHSTQVCGARTSFARNSSIRRDFPDAGLADDLDELAFAFERARPAALKLGEFLLPPDQRRQNPRAAASAAAARPHDAIERDRLARHALEVMRAPVFDEKKPGRLPSLHSRGDEHPSRLARPLCTRAATFGGSPNTSPAASTTTGPIVEADLGLQALARRIFALRAR